MEIEVKHIAPYLPYKLTVQWIREDNKNIVSELNIGDYGFLINRCIAKPILKPLSFFKFEEIDEVKEFLGLGNWCDAYDEFFDSWFKYPSSVQELVLQCNYEVIQYFFANHYDVFDLIGNGLAIKIEK